MEKRGPVCEFASGYFRFSSSSFSNWFLLEYKALHFNFFCFVFLFKVSLCQRNRTSLPFNWTNCFLLRERSFCLSNFCNILQTSFEGFNKAYKSRPRIRGYAILTVNEKETVLIISIKFIRFMVYSWFLLSRGKRYEWIFDCSLIF